MKLVVIPNTDNLDDYINYSKDYVFALTNFSVDYKKTYTLEEIVSLKDKYSINAYVVINKPIFNEDIDDLKDLLLKIEESNISGILFYDLAVLKLHKDLSLRTSLIWNNTHMVTNYKTCDYYFDKGCVGALLSNEITLSEILDISKNTKIKLWMMVVGYPIVAFSRRSLLTNHAMAHKILKSNNLKIREHSTKVSYDVFENEFGTSFRKNEIMNVSSVIDKLDNIDSFVFKEEDIEHDKFIEVLSLYKKYFDGKIKYEEFVSCVNSLIGSDTNFLFNETYYQVKNYE